jgi:integrase
MVKSQLIKPVYGHRPAIIQPDKFAKLLQDIESLATKVDGNTISSLRLLSMLFVRNGDLRRMRWADLDFKEAKWRFQPLKGESKEHMVRDMVVPLPRQAIEILQHQYKINGHSEFVFYSPSAKKNGIISDNTANKHLKELGYQNVHCVHGFRASAKTMLQEQLKYPAVIVEMGLGHITKDQNGTAYGRFEFLDERTEMMQTWADYLDALGNDEDVSRFKNSTVLNPSKGMPEEIMKQLIQQLGKDKILELLK